MAGNRIAHPLLISVANIRSDILSKASNHLLQLLALLPIPSFVHKSQEVRGVLENRLFHRSLDIVLHPLKIAAALGHLLADPVGQVRRCHTPCAAWIVDTPEATLISCVGGGGKTSPFTTAMYKEFGDPFRHPTRYGNTTLEAIDKLSLAANPDIIEAYFPHARKSRTNGVVNPCWRNWACSDPADFLIPEVLHHLHKGFFDHDLKWCINVIGAHELDFRYSLIQKRQGFRSFLEGVSRLKQLTGRDHREIQRYIVSVIVGAAPNRFVTAIRALCDFRYGSQASRYSDATAMRVQRALDEFHSVKDEIIRLNACRNTKGEPLDNWAIPKLEFLQTVFPSIKASGPILQWDANKTERAHITTVKIPARSGNGHNYEIQICRELDKQSRMRTFDLMTSMKDARVDFRIGGPANDGDEAPGAQSTPEPLMASQGPPLVRTVTTTTHLKQAVVPVSAKMWGALSSPKNLFAMAFQLQVDKNALEPLRTFTSNGDYTAFSLTRDPDLKTLSVPDAQKLFELPDFSAALDNYLQRALGGTSVFTIGGRRPNARQCDFPFKVQVWSKLRIQGRQYHNLHLPGDTHTVFAAPPGPDWKFGRNDCVLVNIDDKKKWPWSSLEGHCIALVKVIFAPTYGQPRQKLPGTNKYLAYCERFDVVSQSPPPQEYSDIPCYHAWKPHFPDYSSGCYVLKKALRANDTALGEIIPVSQLRAQVDVAPRLRGAADPRLSSYNVMTFATDYLLNKYWEKEIWYALEKTDACASD